MLKRSHFPPAWQPVLGLLLVLSLGTARAETFAELDSVRVQQLEGRISAAPAGLGPVCADRLAWGSPEIAARTQPLIAAADKLLASTFPPWSDEAYLEYSRQGTRPNGERMMNSRKAWLYPLVLAECAQWQGRYLPAIAQTLSELNAQPTWTWPAHDKGLRNFRLHDYEVDLLAADTAHDVAQSLYMLGDALDERVRRQSLATVEARIFAPMRNSFVRGGKDNWWLQADHNWNAVCLKGVVGAALAVTVSKHERAIFVAAGEHYIQKYVAGFSDDGYSLEGPGYWNYGFSHFTELRELLLQASAETLDLFSQPKVRAIALYGFHIEMLPGNIAAFGDAPRNVKMDDVTRAYANAAWGLGAPQNLADLPINARQSGNAAPLAEAALTLFVRPAPARTAALDGQSALQTNFAQVGVLVSRPATGQKLATAIKAGGNGNHSHNDIGSYTIALGAEQPMGDPGATVYSAKTFSAQRYSIKGISSYGHPVPIVAGQLQRVATEVRPKVLATHFTETVDEITMDLRPAYAVAALTQLTRSLRHDRSGSGSVEVADHFEFSSPQSFEVAVIALGNWQVRDDGQIELWQKSEHLLARIEATAAFTVDDEKVEEEGLFFTRLAIRLKAPAKQGSIRISFRPAERQ